MRILLIGEFSGVHLNFKRVFENEGHKVTLVADGDSFKKFAYDINLINGGGFWGFIKGLLVFVLNLRKFIGNDIVQFNSPFALPSYFYLIGIYQFIISANKKIIYYVGGTDSAFLKARYAFEYFPFDEFNNNERPKFSLLDKKVEHYFLRKVNVIIPSNYMYSVPYEGNSKLAGLVPFPKFNVSGSDLCYSVQGKVKILYARTRDGFKGSEYIIPALDLLKLKYSEFLDVEIVCRLPYFSFIDKVCQADILIDQCKSYDYGMNAILGMELGCIVFSGAEVKAINYSGIPTWPVINIRPSIDEIFNQLNSLLANKSLLPNLKNHSKSYVDTVHSDTRVYSLWLKNVNKV